MGDWTLLEIVLFFAVALPLSIITVGIIIIRAKMSSTADRVICAGAIVTIMSTFLPWYRVEFVKFSLWDTYRGVAFIILAAGAVALAEISIRVMLFGKSVELDSRGALLEAITMLAVSGLAALFAVIRWAYVPSTKVEFTMAFIYERSWGLWVGIIAAVVFATGSAMKLLEKR